MVRINCRAWGVVVSTNWRGARSRGAEVGSFLLFIGGLQPHQAALIGVFFAAIVGAISVILSTLLRDFLAAWWSSRRGVRNSAEDIFRSYAEPLASASTALFWRLDEIVNGDGRAAFLTAKLPSNEFNQYKLRSTYFRLAAVLGWLRAIRRELSFLRTYHQKRVSRLDAAIDAFEKSLADGHEVEIQRLRGLQDLWGIPRISDSRKEERAAVAVEQCIDRSLHGRTETCAAAIESEAQLELCIELGRLIAKESGCNVVHGGVMEETQARSVRQIDIRQAWLYRDWQSAIGDMMIRSSDATIRNFEVIGFGEFEDIVLGPNQNQFRSLRRISALFKDVDVERRDLYDARPAALRKMLGATADLLVALTDEPISKGAVDKKTASKARASGGGSAQSRCAMLRHWWSQRPLL